MKPVLRIPRYDAGFWRATARWGASRLPRWWLRWSPGPIGVGIGVAQERVRDLVRENLRLVHGQRSAVVEALDTASTLANYGHCLAEGFAAASDDPPVFRYTVEGRENLLRARDAGEGAILVTAHAGSWDVAGGVMNLRGFDLAIAMAPERDEKARRISDEARARVGVKVFHVGEDPLSALPLAQHVRKGGAVALQIDRVPPGMRSRATTFFGKPWLVPLGPFQLAQVTGAPLIPVFTARLDYAHHLVKSEGPIFVPRRASSAELDAAIASAMGAVERFVRRFPTQWFHFAPHPLAEESYLDVVDRRAEEQSRQD
ncbi:MAG: lysophospholipid acyltransferase family protein [Deltaproteobacteria bacterium]|nr:lysophospholipid acyltransferase family protein [Deltaproteobacteria bacterium]